MAPPSHSIAACLLLAVASAGSIPSFSSSAGPEQIHLAHRSHDSVWVSWADVAEEPRLPLLLRGAPSKGPPPQPSPGEIHYREQGDNRWRAVHTAAPGRYAFQAQDGEGNPGQLYRSPALYHGVLDRLECGAAYEYYVSSTGNQSQVFSFTTLPCVGAGIPVVTALIGDLGQTSNSSMTMDHIASGLATGIDAEGTLLQQAWLVGDLSYADSAKELVCNHDGGCMQGRWDTWGRMVQRFASSITLQVLPGNHEEEATPMPLVGEPFESFMSRFRGPAGGSFDGPFWYSWEAGNAHFISLSSYRNFSVGSAQYDWLERDLQGVDRERTPWVFVGTHAPWYNSNTHHQNEAEEVGMRLAMEALLNKYEVDVLFCGHVHAYERSHPVYNGTVTPGALTEINIGDGGNREVLPLDDWIEPQPAWSAVRENGFGHGVIRTLNDTHAEWTWRTIATPETTGSDPVTFVKNSALSGPVSRGVTAFRRPL